MRHLHQNRQSHLPVPLPPQPASPAAAWPAPPQTAGAGAPAPGPAAAPRRRPHPAACIRSAPSMEGLACAPPLPPIHSHSTPTFAPSLPPLQLRHPQAGALLHLLLQPGLELCLRRCPPSRLAGLGCGQHRADRMQTVERQLCLLRSSCSCSHRCCCRWCALRLLPGAHPCCRRIVTGGLAALPRRPSCQLLLAPIPAAVAAARGVVPGRQLELVQLQCAKG